MAPVSRDKGFNGMWFEGVLTAIHDETTFEVSAGLLFLGDYNKICRWRKCIVGPKREMTSSGGQKGGESGLSDTNGALQGYTYKGKKGIGRVERRGDGVGRCIIDAE